MPRLLISSPALERTVRRFQQDNSDVIEWEVRDFPLNADCNPAVRTRLHSNSCRAAVAARVAERHLEPVESRAFRDRLYSRHGRLTETDIQQELAATRLSSLFSDRYAEFLRGVEADTALGRELGVTSTPTVFIDGRIVRDAQPRTVAAILTHFVQTMGERAQEDERRQR